MSDRNRDVEPNGVYVVLWSILGDPKRYHWGVFIALATNSGLMLHCTHGPNTGHRWAFQKKTNYTFNKSLSFLGAVKISEIVSSDENMLQHVTERLADVDFNENTDNCRMWTKRSVYRLAEEGLIGLQPDWATVDDIEIEANELAQHNAMGGDVSLKKSENYRT